MSAPSPVTSMQTPQREFAGAKVLLFFDIYKKICTFDADFLILWSIGDYLSLSSSNGSSCALPSSIGRR